MRSRTISANVLNEADRFQRIMDYQIFTMEQENLLWGYSPDTDWVPGDPIHEDPRLVERESWAENVMPEGYEGNHVRPMIEIANENLEKTMRCKDCQVSGDRSENDCWNCGKPYLSYGLDRFGSMFSIRDTNYIEYSTHDAAMVMDFWISANRNLRLSLARQSQAFRTLAATIRGAHTNYVILDELVNFKIEPISFEGCDIPAYDNPFKKSDRSIERVRSVAADLLAPKHKYWGPVNLPALPTNWAELRNTVALPEMSEPQPLRSNWPTPVSFERPITERRRTR